MHLALINIAKAKYPMDDSRMSGFVNNLDAVNKAAERSPGFVWRLIDNVTKSATSIIAFKDPNIITNMAVWENLEALENYTYRTIHKRVFASRNNWFDKMDGPHMALWWIKEGEIPTVEEGKRRLQMIADNGSSAGAFTFGDPFSPTGIPEVGD
ncbi:MAG: DUF3291 domain-containing protein [Devosiaceae bacterium]|nr:DUF3291 domain-containing protein [Devosiaceae bacterium]